MDFLVKCSGVYLSLHMNRCNWVRQAATIKPYNDISHLRRFEGSLVLNKHTRRLFKVKSIKNNSLFGLDVYFEGYEFPFYGVVEFDLIPVNYPTNYHTGQIYANKEIDNIKLS